MPTLAPDVQSFIDDYLDHCRNRGLAPRHIAQKKTHLERYIADAGDDWCSADGLLRSMRGLVDRGKSARTANFRRQIVRAWGAWCVKSGRLGIDPFSHVEPFDERGDKRYVRRALTDDEVDRLLEYARGRGPLLHLWYALGVYVGLRRGELEKLKWRAVRLDEGVIVIEEAKSGKTDRVPIVPQLAEVLATVPRGPAERRVFMYRHGISRLDIVMPREFREAGVTRRDAEGRHGDFHSLRRTLHMRLVRAGVAPQICQAILRHSDYRVTLSCYTDSLTTEATAALSSAFSTPTPARSAEAPSGDLGGWIESCPVSLSDEQRHLLAAMLTAISSAA